MVPCGLARPAELVANAGSSSPPAPPPTTTMRCKAAHALLVHQTSARSWCEVVGTIFQPLMLEREPPGGYTTARTLFLADHHAAAIRSPHGALRWIRRALNVVDGIELRSRSRMLRATALGQIRQQQRLGIVTVGAIASSADLKCRSIVVC